MKGATGRGGNIGVDAIWPLIGVLVGGLLAISGQILQASLQQRAETRRRHENVRVVARLQQDGFWTFQNAAAKALQTGCWPNVVFEQLYQPTQEDMRVLAGVLPAAEWKIYASAIRRRAECVTAAPPAGSQPETLPRDDLQRIVIAYASSDDARHLLARHSGVEPRQHWLGQSLLSNEEISTLVRRIHSSRQMNQEWVERITAPKRDDETLPYS